MILDKRLWGTWALVAGMTALAAPAGAQARQDAVAGVAALTSIHMNTGLAGWAINHQSAIIRTTNGGVSWSDVTPNNLLPARVTVTATYFPTAQVAWAALTNAAAQNPTTAIIIHTGDGGRTWQRGTVRLANPGQIGEILFLAGRRVGWLFADLGAGAGSDAVQIFRTTDGGMQWNSVSTTTPPHSSPGSLPLGGIKSGIGFRNVLAGFATGIVYGPPGFSYLYATDDGGHTWRHQGLALPPAYRGENPALTPPIFFTARDGLLPAILAGLVQLIYVTHDGGATWTGTTPLHNARNLDVVTIRDMWAVESADAGSAGRPLRLYVTHDGGFHWAAIGPNTAIRDGATLDFIDNQTGFVLYPALGSGGTTTLLKTVDGGHSWSTIHPYVLPHSSRDIHPSTALNTILDLSFVDTSRGWALGTSCPSTAAPCKLAARTTRDGGWTWRAVGAPPPSLPGRPDEFSARRISFADGRIGWAFDPGLFVTRDSGRTWAADGRIGEVVALAPLAGTVWAVSETCAVAVPSRCASTLWISPDGGRTWRRAPAQPGVGGTGVQLIRASARDAWILSSGPGAAMLAATHDGGATWRARVDPCDAHGKGFTDRDRLAVSSGKLWLLCGGQPAAGAELKALYVSHDGGQNWRSTATTGDDTPQQLANRLPGGGYVDSIAATTLKHAWIGLDRGTLYETSDGGYTWVAAIPIQILNPGGATVGSIVFVDSMHGWVATYNRVFHTVDGGAHWQAVTVR